MPSNIDLAVPALSWPSPAIAISSWVAPGSFSLTYRAMQSVGTTSNPTPDISTTPFFFAASS